jgi:hypothetical protein
MAKRNIGYESNVDSEIEKGLEELEAEKEEKMLNLIVEIIVEATLKEYYEEGD